MPSIFPTQPGTYVKLEDDSSQSSSGSAVFEIPGLELDGVLIVTKYNYSQRAKTQYRSVLSGDVFIYPLGNEMGTLQVSGIVPYKFCEGAGDPQIGKGFQKLVEFYNKHRASSAKNIKEPVKILLPGLSDVINCYLESLAISGVDPKNLLFGFDLIFRAAPAEDP